MFLKVLESSSWDRVWLFKNLYTTHITITLFNVNINIIKGTLIFTLGDSGDVLKTISATHTTIIGITIMFRNSVVIH